MKIELQGAMKHFGRYLALDHLDLQIPAGEMVAVLGPSGCGKTTLLRIIAGLEPLDQGLLQFDGVDATRTPVQERRVGFVFQHYALFGHMTIFENVAFGLRLKPRRQRLSEASIRKRVMDLLAMVQLEQVASRHPAQLSGGQRQRIAFARALAAEPRLLLLDEPFGALDARVRHDLRQWLRQMHALVPVTTLFVTHDQTEAVEVAERVVVMKQGRIEQSGTMEELLANPATPFVADFMGGANLFHGRMENGATRIGEILLETPPGSALAADTMSSAQVICIRSHDWQLERHPNGQSTWHTVVRQMRPLGAVVRLGLESLQGAGRIDVELTREQYEQYRFQPGDTVFAHPRRVRIFADDPKANVVSI
ncbi:MAG: sulfate/molybdate ABC transporter ATP-binding protein [Magnetococcales bacterium]|nr:sulfate/molybdate ABC transporter ATP-binding protein [Magnetococcales bacterium]